MCTFQFTTLDLNIFMTSLTWLSSKVIKMHFIQWPLISIHSPFFYLTKLIGHLFDNIQC